MLSKPVGATGLYALNTVTGTVNVVTLQTGDLYGQQLNATLPARKVRIAVTAPACIAFGTDVANNNSDILMPANTVEHFSISSSTISYVVLNGSSAGYISITPVA